MIDVICHTNIDEGKYKDWPTRMACRPVIGDKVRARDGYELVICDISHAEIEPREDPARTPSSAPLAPDPFELPCPVLIIELIKTRAAFSTGRSQRGDGPFCGSYITTP